MPEKLKASIYERLKVAGMVGAKILRADEAKGDPVFPRGYSSSWTDGFGRPFVMGFPGSNVDYAKETGDLTFSSLVMAIVNFIATMLTEAPPQVLRYSKSGKGEPIPDHPLTNLLLNPNPFDDFSVFMQCFALSYLIGGNNYWLKQRDERFLEVNGLWYLPHFMVNPTWDRDDPQSFITAFRYAVDGRKIDYLPEDIVHFKRGKDLKNVRKGAPAFDPVLSEIYTDMKAGNFAAMIFKNMGIIQYLISPPKPTGAQGPGAGVADFGFGKDEGKARAKALMVQEGFMRATTGDNVGKPVVQTIPMEITKLSSTPAELDMKELRMIPESRVAGVVGVPAAVVQYLVGLQNGTSYASYEQAREQAYESVIIPMQRIIASVINRHLLPDFPAGGGAREEFTFDISKVRVLQDDQDKLYTRETRVFQVGGQSHHEYRASLGKAKPEGPDFYLLPNSYTPITVEKLMELAAKPKALEPPPPPPVPGQLPPGQEEGDPGKPAPRQLGPAKGNDSGLAELRRRLTHALSNGSSVQDKALARRVIGLLGEGEKSVQYEGMTLGRIPTDLEKRINLKAIQDAFDSGEKELARQLEVIRKKLIEDAAAGVIKLDPADYHTLTLAVSAEAALKLRDQIQKIYEKARELIVQELEAQGAPALGEIGVASEVSAASLDTLGDVTVSRLINDVQARAASSAAGLTVSNITGEALEAGIVEELEGGSSSYVSNAAAEADHAAFGLGRVDEGSDRADIISEVYYSAVLDENSCGPCSEADGETGATEAEVTPCPNPACEGGARCRCILVFVFNSEEAA